ncbi:MAG TPA: hypothetical protein VG777_01430 [Thermoanaerobaculia bacterium]|nr:hypothetical protein [Thermoanaerobaculia bacterium]
MRSASLFAAAVFAAGAALAGGAPHDCPMDTAAEGHRDCPMAAPSAHRHTPALSERGAAGMGFSQEKTTHHFRLSVDGGAIEVTVNDSADAGDREQIRRHLAHVREMFSAGDFSIPMFVHDGVPPGTATMKRRASAIRYRYEDLPGGGRVAIATSDPDALDAIHDFLRFQITEHQTGDPLEVPGEHRAG